MKPVKLIMSAFGSYGGTEVIEFDKIQNGLFLIAGDTGAGKSTIFDAIMFALYDTMSGKERKSIMMRSEYASDNMETYVEYTFSYGSSIYTIKRFPAYVRKSKRRNKDGQYNIIRQQGKVELTMPDGIAYNGKIAQVNQKIEEITGLTAEQFNKIALIAQGEFQELVMDRTGKRKEIFRQIFSTQIYGDIEDIIFKRYKAEASQIKYNSTKLEELVKGIDFQEDSPYKEDFNIAFERKDTEPDRLPDIMRAETSRLKDIYNSKQNLYIEKETEYKKLNNYITKGKEKNKLIDRLLEFEKQKEKLSSLKEDIENKIIVLGLARKAEKVLFAEKNYNNRKEECTKASKKYEELKLKEEELNKQYNISLEKYHQADKEYRQLMPGYITKRDNLKQDVIKYKTVSEKENELLRLESLLKKVVSEKENEIKILAKIKEDINSYEEIIKSYNGLELETEKAGTAQKNCNEKQELLNKLKKKKEACDSRQYELTGYEKKLLSCIKKWEESRRQHEEYNRAYIACQSAFLAENLVPGSPCPVCGSIEHPQAAVMPDDAVTEDMVKKAEAAEHKYELDKNRAQEETKEIQSAFVAEIAVLNDYLERLSGKEKLSLENYLVNKLDIFIKEKQSLILEEDNQINTRLKQLLEKAKDRQNKQDGLKKLIVKQDKTVVLIENKEKEIHQLELKAEGIKNEIKTLEISFVYKTREEAEKNLNDCENNLNLLEKKYKNADKEFKDIQKKFTNVQGAMEELKRQVKELSGSLDELSETFQISIKENGFVSPTEYREALKETSVIQRMEEDITKYKEMCVQNNTGIQTIKEQLEDTVKVKLGELEEALNNTSVLMAGLKQELDKYNFYIQNNTKLLERLLALMEERSAISEKLKVIKSLNDTANGKVHFQTYIQRQYFKQIIQAANRRLSSMASGKFLLKCRDIGTGGQGETGLELDVYNPLTGKSRDAHTLSGGETFMASLSMALGMADIVQNTVGKTRLDTMFIDEGFGSLSDDVRDKAVNVLLELAGNNRLVGVISHVSELKDRVPEKLIVTKGNNGSSVKWDR